MARRVYCQVLPVALIVSLSASASAQEVLHTLVGEQNNESFGVSVANAGDVDQDGVNDIIAGSRYHVVNGQPAGKARVFSGLDGAVIHEFPGTTYAEWYSLSVSGAGDIDGDGYADVIVGSPHNDLAGTDRGAAFVYSGQTGLTLYTFTGINNNEWFGYSVSSAGDYNNDGIPDVIAGGWRDASFGADSGRAAIHSGLDGSLLGEFFGDSTGDEMGFSVASAGDVDNDGWDDVILSLLDEDVLVTDDSEVRVYSGFDNSIIHSWHGDSTFDWFGYSVDGIGDINDDGHADLIVGAPQDDNNGKIASGMARIFSGIDGSILYSHDGGLASETFGFLVRGAGDVTGDGRPDYMVGAPWGPGSIAFYSGADGSRSDVLFGTPGSKFGFCADDMGDLDGNGVGEVVIGAPFEPHPSGAGRVYVVSDYCGDVFPYGAGCLGSGDFNPVMNLAGCPTSDAQAEFTITNGMGGATALIFFGNGRSTIPLLPGCPLLIGPLTGAVLAFPLLGSLPGEGEISIPFIVPPTVPSQVNLQTLIIDAGVPKGYSSTNALEVQLKQLGY